MAQNHDRYDGALDCRSPLEIQSAEESLRHLPCNGQGMQTPDH